MNKPKKNKITASSDLTTDNGIMEVEEAPEQVAGGGSFISYAALNADRVPGYVHLFCESANPYTRGVSLMTRSER